MMKPTIHLNGTSPEALEHAYLSVGHALVVAMEALSEAAPNARDYPQDYHLTAEARFKFACDEHNVRMNKLRDMRDEFMNLISHVQDEIDSRAERRR